MHRIPNPRILPLGQPSTHVAAVGLVVKASVDILLVSYYGTAAAEALVVAGSTVDEAGKTVAEVSVDQVGVLYRRPHTLDIKPLDVAARA